MAAKPPRFDPSKPPPAMKRCGACGKPSGYKGWFGPECQCGIVIRNVPSHSIASRRD